MKRAELQQFSPKELAKHITTLQGALFVTKFKIQIGKENKFHTIKQLKKNIAQALTYQNEQKKLSSTTKSSDQKKIKPTTKSSAKKN